MLKRMMNGAFRSSARVVLRIISYLSLSSFFDESLLQVSVIVPNGKSSGSVRQLFIN
jgi:hypothetical protein